MRYDDYERVTLEKQRMVLQQVISDSMLRDHLQYDIHYSMDVMRGLVVRMEAQVFGRCESVKHTIPVHMRGFTRTVEAGKAPAGWWQALKERFAPQWFLKRYPVVYQTFTGTVVVEDRTDSVECQLDLMGLYPDILAPQHHCSTVQLRQMRVLSPLDLDDDDGL